MKIQKELDETKITLHKTIESVLERGEKIDSVSYAREKEKDGGGGRRDMIWKRGERGNGDDEKEYWLIRVSL